VGYFQDEEFRERVLALLTRDRKFLRRLSGKLTPQDFKANKSEGDDGWARQWVATECLRYWQEYRQPIAGLLRTFALDYIRENRTKVGKNQRETLLNLIEKLKDPELSVSVDAIQDKILKYKERQFLRQAVDEMVGLTEEGKLQLPQFRKVVSDVMKRIDFDERITVYGDTLERRIRRRELEQGNKYPLLYIEAFDQATRTIPRGQVGLVLAPYKIGKSSFMAHLAQAHAIQGLHVALFTLEDPETLVEDRLDGSICGFKIAELLSKSKELKKRFREVMDSMRAKIFLIDATGGGWTIQRMVETVDNLRNRGETIDVVLIDYDEQVEALGKYTGEHAVRMRSQEVWLDTVRWAARDDIWIWMAAQATVSKERDKQRRALSGEDTAEDKSKIRKVGIGLGVSSGDDDMRREFGDNARWLQVMAHRFGRSRMGWPIVSDFDYGIFYDRENSLAYQKKVKPLRPDSTRSAR
jgi:KaiC/GvpD/RAD55 family RecA-like ATPase